MCTANGDQFSILLRVSSSNYFFFFFQAEDGIRDVAVTGVQTCALPIFAALEPGHTLLLDDGKVKLKAIETSPKRAVRSEEHTSELQSRLHLVCRLLLEKKKRCRLAR